MITTKEYNEIVEDRDRWRKSAQDMSRAYVRLRELIPGALNTPTAPSPEEIQAITENSIKNLLARLQIREGAM